MPEEMQQMPVSEAPQSPVETPAPEAPKADVSDVEQNKVMAIVGYIIPLLFFVPMLAEKRSPFGMFHANQHLLLLISAIIVQVAGAMIPLLGWFVILPLGGIAIIVLAIMGIINAAKGEMKKLPIIGGYSLLK